MSLPLNPDMIEAAYNFLCTTPPFNKWKLPSSDEVVFRINLAEDCFATYRWDGENHTITVSLKAVAHTITLLEKLSHELVHLYLEKEGLESKNGGSNVHNAAFRKYAARVCKYHGFDPKAFY